MKKFIYLFILSSIGTYSSCSEEETIIDYLSPVHAVLDGKAVGDPYEILSLSIDDGKLFLKVRYGGGCEDHTFSLDWNGVCDDSSSEMKTHFAIIHDANNDLCEALITEEIVIDYQAIILESGTVVDCGALNFIHAQSMENYYIGVGMEKIVQGNELTMEVELTEAICATGFLGDLWFKSTDITLYDVDEFFFFQPTNIATDQVFEKGRYKIGVRLEEKYNGDDVTCLAYPGPSIPAEILSIQKLTD